MKTIGLIGGMGWESSKRYYDLINRKVNAVLGGSHSAKVIMVSVDFAEIERLTFKKDWVGIGTIMAESTKQLERAGADIIVLCTNLIHLASEFITSATSLPFLHIATTTGEAVKREGLKKVLLLGTQPTMEMDFYTEILKTDFNLEVIVPNQEHRQALHGLIYKELLKGIFTAPTKKIILDIIDDGIGQGAEGIILGCTELNLIIGQEDVSMPVFDTGKLHAHCAVHLALSD